MRRLALLIAVLLGLVANAALAQQKYGKAAADIRSFGSFGASCDGTTDDATAFASAVSWMSGGTNRQVQLPAATCATTATVTIGNGRQLTTTTSAGLSGGENALTVSSISGIQNGDTCILKLDSGTQKLTVNGTPSGSSVPVTPVVSGAATSGNLVVCGYPSTYNGSGFVGYGSGGTAGEIVGTGAVSEIKYTGSAAASTTLSSTAAAGATSLSVASITGFYLTGAVGVTLDDGSVWWTLAARTPSGTTVTIHDPLPSQATSGNAVKAGLPVAKVQGAIYSATLKGVRLNANSLASVGLETISAYRGQFTDIMATGYTGIGEFVHTAASHLLGTTSAVADSTYTLYANGPQNTKTIGLFFSGFCSGGITGGFSRNRFEGGSWQGGGNDTTAASIRENWADNNTFMKPFGYKAGSGTSGAGLYRQAGQDANCASLGANTFVGAALDNGVTDNIPSGAGLNGDYFPGYVTIDGEPIPTTGQEWGHTDLGAMFGPTLTLRAAGNNVAQGTSGGAWQLLRALYTKRAAASSSPYTTSTGADYYVGVTTLPMTVNLTNSASQEIVICDEAGTAGTNAITVTPSSGTINGASNYLISSNWGCAHFRGVSSSAWQTVDMTAKKAYHPVGGVASPTGTSSATFVMMGLGSSWTLTPNGPTVVIAASGNIANSTGGDGAAVGLMYGTGTAPTNGAAATGTNCSKNPSWISPTNNAVSMWSLTCVLTGLTPGTAYWFDAQLERTAGGTASLTAVTVSAFEP